MFQSTRRRLALWYTCVTAVVLVVFAVGVYGYARYTLIDRIDDTLNHVAEVVERSIRAEARQDPQRLLSLSIWQQRTESDQALQDDYEDDHIDLEWFGPDGGLRWASSPHTADLPLKPGVGTIYLSSGYGLRQITDPVTLGEQVLGYLRVSHPWFEVTKPIRQLTLDLGLGLGGMILSVGLIGWLLSGLAMRPVRESYQRLKQFTADASHELRSPLASLQTTVQATLRDPDLDLPTRHKWETVERLSRRLGQLVEDLLFLARQDQQEVLKLCTTECHLDGILLQVEELQRALALQKGIQLELDIPDSAEDYCLQGDPEQLLRLFSNLVINSLQYTPEQGRVSLRLRRILGGSSGLTQFQVEVQDNGAGIPAAALPHVFDRFYRADPSRSHSAPWPKGTGLGLAIAKTIVERHHGEIQLDSQEHQGTTVIVRLPAPKIQA